MKYIVLLFALLASACSTTTPMDTAWKPCEDSYMKRGDLIVDLRTGEIGAVELSCHYKGDTKVMKVILENREGTALVRREVPRMYVAAITRKEEEL